MQTAEVAYRFYESQDGLVLDGYRLHRTDDDWIIDAPTPALRHEEQISREAVQSKLEEIGHSLQLVEYGGSTFEVALVNADASDEEVMLHISTYSSSISGNKGNAYELAAQAVRYPNHRHVYVASFGNGGTTPILSTKERKYVRQTGRLTWEKEGRTVAIPSIKNLQGALGRLGTVTRIMGTDSAGGSYATALGVEMGPGQLTHTFFSEKAGFINLSKAEIIGGILLKEQFKNAKHNREVSFDPEMVTAEKVEIAKSTVDAYSHLPNRQYLSQNQVKLPGTIVSLWTSMQGLRRGPCGAKNPLVEDTNALLRQQPQMKLTYGIAEEDPLYQNFTMARAAAFAFLEKLDAGPESSVRVIFIPGMTHAYNTYFPSLYHAVKRHALEL